MRFLLVFLIAFASVGCIDDVSDAIYPESSADTGPDVPDCDGETSEQLCADAKANCGALTVTDSCGVERTVDCGNSCVSPNVCGGVKPNECGCVEIPDEAYCGLVAAECGIVSGTDPCGNPRAVSCGECDDSATCIGNSCNCDSLPNAEICMAQGAQCGAITFEDDCGDMRTIECGECGDQETCGGDNLCSCMQESDDELCARNTLNCGEVTATLIDNCGIPRTGFSCGPQDCGSTNPDFFCGGGGQENVCGCQTSTDAQLCGSQMCGFLQVTDSCGQDRNVNCGTCTLPNSCGGGDDPLQCGCTDESDAEFCARRDFCGVVNGPLNNCGNPVTNVNCGSCSDPNEQCGVAAANRCTCVPESQTDFCMTLGATCGTVSGTDQCGNSRNAFCGDCASGFRCENMQCECVEETNVQFCARLNGCGMVTADNNCGIEKTVNCGQCVSGTCTNNRCTNCTPWTNPQFCAANSANCGSVMGTDNCNQPRDVDCGGCVDPFDCESNVCVCEADLEEEEFYCTEAMAECGSVTIVDECNKSHTFNCGACDNPNDDCEYNKCVCYGPSAQELCDQAGAECGTLSVTDFCGDPRNPNCGQCSGLDVCLGNQCVLDINLPI